MFKIFRNYISQRSLFQSLWSSNSIRFCSNFQSSEKIAKMKELLTSQLRSKSVDIEDTSGGCGAFYRISVSSPEFQNRSLVQQHKMVKEVLKDHIKDIHGLTLKTKTE